MPQCIPRLPESHRFSFKTACNVFSECTMYMVCVKYRLEAASLLQSVSFVVSLYLSAFDISQGLVWFLSAMDVLRYAWNANRGN